MLDNFVNWEFLDEPLYRWFIAIGCLIAILWAWRGVLDFID